MGRAANGGSGGGIWLFFGMAMSNPKTKRKNQKSTTKASDILGTFGIELAGGIVLAGGVAGGIVLAGGITGALDCALAGATVIGEVVDWLKNMKITRKNEILSAKIRSPVGEKGVRKARSRVAEIF